MQKVSWMERKQVCIKEMREYVLANGVTEFCDLMDYANEHRYDDWFKMLCDSRGVVYAINNYIGLLRRKIKRCGAPCPS